MTNEGNTHLSRTLIIERNVLNGNGRRKNGDKEQKMWVPTPGHFCVEGKGKKRLLTFR